MAKHDRIQGEIDQFTTTVEDFHTYLSVTDSKSRPKNSVSI